MGPGGSFGHCALQPKGQVLNRLKRLEYSSIFQCCILMTIAFVSLGVNLIVLTLNATKAEMYMYDTRHDV